MFPPASFWVQRLSLTLVRRERVCVSVALHAEKEKTISKAYFEHLTQLTSESQRVPVIPGELSTTGEEYQRYLAQLQQNVILEVADGPSTAELAPQDNLDLLFADSQPNTLRIGDAQYHVDFAGTDARCIRGVSTDVAEALRFAEAETAGARRNSTLVLSGFGFVEYPPTCCEVHFSVLPTNSLNFFIPLFPRPLTFIVSASPLTVKILIPAIEYQPTCCEVHFLCSHPTRTFIASASPLTVKIVVPAIEYRPACCEVHFLCSSIMVGGMIQRRSRQYTTSTLLLTISSSFRTRMGEDQNVAADLEGERRRMLGCVQLHVCAAQEDVDVGHAMSTGNIWASCRRTRWKTWPQRMAATTRKTVPACDLPSLDVVGSGLSKLTSSRTTRHSEHFIWLLLPQNLDQWTSFSLLRNLAHHALASTSATTPLPGTPYPVYPTHFDWGTRHSAPVDGRATRPALGVMNRN
ncbi:hypothetical protein B0H14DRAFT_3500482 [Mycena olivaceomarginata]|nr:hypothetical protein B0H14DRAFT_3500482 [Mycena olivaceomarginata]